MEETHQSCAAQLNLTGAPNPATSPGSPKSLIRTPNNTTQSTNAAAKTADRNHRGSRPSTRAGNVCTASRTGSMRCGTGSAGP